MPDLRNARPAFISIKGTAAALSTLMLVSVLASSAAEARCGSRGGPGYRRSDGKCASHRD